MRHGGQTFELNCRIAKVKQHPWIEVIQGHLACSDSARIECRKCFFDGTSNQSAG